MNGDLEASRAHYRRMAKDPTVAPRDRVLFTSLADEIDAYEARELEEQVAATEADVPLEF